MKIAIISLALLISACTSVPVERKFPSVPTELQQACPDLKTLNPETTKLSVVVDVVVTNYGQYKECQVKVDSWNEWYKNQKEIFESVK
jgi:starvation-inducible outer membrane lipoprotein